MFVARMFAAVLLAAPMRRTCAAPATTKTEGTSPQGHQSCPNILGDPQLTSRVLYRIVHTFYRLSAINFCLAPRPRRSAIVQLSFGRMCIGVRVWEFGYNMWAWPNGETNQGDTRGRGPHMLSNTHPPHRYSRVGWCT